MKERSTIDLVIIIITVTVGCTVLLTVMALFIMRLMHPEADTSRAAEAVMNIVTTLVGSLVGFIGGRATGRWEGANGGVK